MNVVVDYNRTLGITVKAYNIMLSILGKKAI